MVPHLPFPPHVCVAYGKIQGISHIIFLTLRVWHAPWFLTSGCRTPPYMTLWHHIQLWHHIWTHMMSSMTSSLHHWHMLAKPIKGAAWCLLGFILVPLSSCEVLIHAGIDVLTCLHFWRPTSFKDNWLGCCLLLPWAYTLCGCLYTFWECPMSTTILSTSTILQDLHTFGWFLCALYSSCW